MKNNIDSSRKRTPWDNHKNITSVQSFIKEKYIENYNYKHPKLSETDEYKLINNIIVNDCPYCHSVKIKKNGKKQKIQKYYCNTCKKEFNPLTNTIFADRKISITEWIEFTLSIINYNSLSQTSKINKNSLNTSIFWLHKLFLILEDYQDNIILSGEVYLDETFYSVVKSEIRLKTNGKKYRGLSENQWCIGIACDDKNVIAFVEDLGKTSSDLTEECFKDHIKEGSHLIHDKEKSHDKLIKRLKLVSIAYDSNKLKGIDDKFNPLDKINNLCDLLKKFLRSHSGFDRKDLQNYLNLFCFISNRSKISKLDKVEELLNLAIKKRVHLTYRELFNQKK